MIQISCWFYPEIDLLVFWNVEIKWILTENMYFYFGPTSAQNNEEFAGLMLILTWSWNGLVSIMKTLKSYESSIWAQNYGTLPISCWWTWNWFVSVLISWNEMDSYRKYFYFGPTSAQNYEEFASLMLILTWNGLVSIMKSMKSYEGCWILGRKLWDTADFMSINLKLTR